MKIFSAPQVKEWDAYTIKNEPIASIDLMERAATACCNWLIGKNFGQPHFRIFCGKGNNGGDGLALARLLIGHQRNVTVYILEFGNKGTEDFQTNLERLHQCTVDIHFIQSADFFPVFNDNDVIIDALFGTGLNKPLEGISRELVAHINGSKNIIVSIDMPSGLYADKSSKGNAVINATITLSFQDHKLAFLLPENEGHCGEVHLLHIGLHKDFEEREQAVFELADKELVAPFYRPRSKFAHKGTYGHALLICGSHGMMGAAVLCARACLRSGVGKLTCLIPQCGYSVLQTAVPEAMCVVNGDDHIAHAAGIEKYDTIGAGPGIGLYPSHKKMLAEIFKKTKQPLVIDADALNVLSRHRELIGSIPPLSILTPHPGEFERIFDSVPDDFNRIGLALQKAGEHNIYIILKGHYSFVATPEGKGYFNSTGNPGMATAGSGDVLTGIITGLLAQGYSSLHAALLGIYLHGLAGDIAAERYSEEAMTAGDIVDCVGDAFKTIR